MRNIITFFLIIFGIFVFVGLSSASTADRLQPASAHVIDEELQVLGTARVYSLRVGAQGYGGVTYFDGTIINSTTSTVAEAEVENPVTFGDDVRIDGRVWRGASAGPEDDGSTPFVINDNLEVLGTIQGSDLIGASGLTTSNAGSSGQVLSLNSSGVLEWADDAIGSGSGSSGDITGVTAGSGLTGGGTSGAVTLNVSGITSSMITDGTIVAGDIASGAVTSAKILDGTIIGTDLTATYNSGSVFDARFLNDNIDEIMSGSLTINDQLIVSSGSETGITVTGSPTNLISATNSSSTGRAVYGYASANSGTYYGGYFRANNTGGIGVYGLASTQYAVEGEVTHATGLSGYFHGGDFVVELGTDSEFWISTDGGGVGIDVSDPQQALDVDGLIGLQDTDSPGACGASDNVGAIYFDTTTNEPCYCDGRGTGNWISIIDGTTNCAL